MLFFSLSFFPVTCHHNVQDCYWSWRLGFWLRSLFSYHTWLNGIVILVQRVECNFLPRNTILAISVKEQMENVDRSHKWYWLGYRIPAVHGRGTKKIALPMRMKHRKYTTLVGWIYGTISFHFICSLGNFFSAVYITAINVPDLLICANEQLRRWHTSWIIYSGATHILHTCAIHLAPVIYQHLSSRARGIIKHQ